MTADDIKIHYRNTEGGDGKRKLFLSISYDALFDLLSDESAVMDPADVPGLLRGMTIHALEADHPEDEALLAWKAQALADIRAQREDDDADDGEEEEEEEEEEA